MGGIVWIASFPKSGNTWVRAFLHNLLQPESGGHDIMREGMNANSKAVQESRKDAAAARKKAVEAEEKVIAARTDLDRTKAELVTQPTQPVVRLQEMAPGLWVSGDFIYLRPSAAHVAFGDYNPAFALNLDGGRMIDVKTGYDPGFRIGGGWNFGVFDMAVAYQYLRSSTTTSATTRDPPPFGSDLFIPVGYYAYGRSGEIKWSVDYDVFDFETGMKLALGPDIMMRPFAGVRYARIDQNLDGFITEPNGDIASVTAKNDVWGIGPRVGVDVKWIIGGGFDLWGRLGGSFLVGTRDRANRTTFSDGSRPAEMDQGGSRANLLYGVDASIGLGYTWQFSQTMSLAVKVGYQIEHWLNTQRFLNGSVFAQGNANTGATVPVTFDGFFVRGVLRF